ncbi:MAG: hypothetical protein V7K90_11830 [Nostoc sp.]|uniref:hypothetical protein n=1 Tax=Nostoc sp. TaxID=1180 RepID=UPI002FFA24C4
MVKSQESNSEILSQSQRIQKKQILVGILGYPYISERFAKNSKNEAGSKSKSGNTFINLSDRSQG